MNLMELYVKIGADTSGLDSGLSSAASKVEGFASKIGSGLKTVAKVGAAAVGAAGAVVTKITQEAVSSYADYEQLAGGIETLFGKSAHKVMRDANNAFKTAGMSVNEYMETSIQSAAALINSLDGDQAKAADMMNMSITDMADNVNKMGTSMEAVQNAYRGFSRGNFTMLDNLALGFAGSKDGMKELIKKAKEFSGIDYNIESYSDIVQAIHVVQEEMGITGTTAKEASGTISGSLSAVKSAWQNLLTGIARPNSNLDRLINNLVDSAETAAKNLIPIVEKALEGIASLIEKLAPLIAKKLPGFIRRIVPKLLDAAVKIVDSLAEVFPDVASELIPPLLDAAERVVETIVKELPKMLDMLPDLIEFAVKMASIIGEGLIEAAPIIAEKAPEIIKAFTDAISENPEALIVLGPFMIGKIVKGISGALGLLNKIGSPISKAFGKAVEKPLAQAATKATTSAINGMVSVGSFLKADIGANLAAGGATAGATIGASIVGGIAAFFGGAELGKLGGKTLSKYLFPDDQELQEVYDQYAGISGTFAMIKDAAVLAWEEAGYAASDAWEGIKSGASESWENVQGTFAGVGEWFSEKFGLAKEGAVAAWEQVESDFDESWNTIKSVYDEVSTYFQEQFELAKKFVLDPWGTMGEEFSKIWEQIKSAFKLEEAAAWGRDMIENFIGGIREKWESLKSTVVGVGQMIKDNIGHSHPKEGPLADDYTWMPDMMDLFAQGIKDGEKDVRSQIESTFDFGNIVSTPALAGVPSGTTTAQPDVVSALTDALSNVTLQVLIGGNQLDAVVNNVIVKGKYRSGGR